MATLDLSSMYEDLKACRHVTFETQRKSGHHVFPREDHIASDQPPVVKCLKAVGKANRAVRLFAFRDRSVLFADQVNSNE
jgi:hypothetical protein